MVKGKIKRKGFTLETNELFLWENWRCYECKKNTASASHHIAVGIPENISNSPYNLSRLCNYECHINRRNLEPLHGFETQSKFLKITKKILDKQGYRPTENDLEFLEMFEEYYK